MYQKSLVDQRLLRVVMIVIGFTIILPASAWAQAVFAVSSTPTTAVKSGQTELLGSLLITVNSGTTAADTIQLLVSPAVIAQPTDGITVSGVAGLAGASVVSVAADAGIVAINIPAGAISGASLTVSGIRISIPALNGVTSIDARLSLRNNFLAANQTSARVLNTVTDGIVVDSTTDSSFTVALTALADSLGAFIFREGAPNAFSSSIGTLGQTQPSQVIFQLTGLPDGVTVTFPQTITGTAGAILTTISSEPLTNLSTPARKAYTFTDSPGGPSTTETFSVTPIVDITQSRGSGTVFLQVGLGPFTNSTNIIPRYTEQLFPSLTASQTITRTLTFPAATADTKVVVSNVSSGAAFLTVRARQSDGTVVVGANNATFNVLAKQSVSVVPRLAFPSVNLNSLATIEVESQSPRVIGNTLDRMSTATYVLPFVDEANTTFLPFDRKTSADVPVAIISNTGTDTAALTITLRSSVGQLVATSSRSVPPLGLLKEPLTTLFSVQSGAFGLSGYIVISSATRVRASLLNNPGGAPEAVFGVTSVGQSEIPIPFFAFGGPYATTVSLINASSTVRAHFTLGPFRVSGGPLTGKTPYSGDINPGERLDLDLARTFGVQNLVAVGSLSLTVDPITPGNPFSGPPPVSGLVRISTGVASTTLPISSNSGTELFLSPTTHSNDEYTGVAIVNPGAIPTDVTVELTTSDGVSRGASTFTLAAGSMRSSLLRELITGLVLHQDGTLRISSLQPVFAVGFRGSLTLSDLTYLHVQTAPQ